MTYEQLIDLCQSGDPLVDVERPGSWSVTDEGLVCLGETGGTSEQSDLRILVEPDGLRAWLRDAAGATGDGVFHGPEWTQERHFDSYEALVDWVYSW